jgi:hypothetical protein
MIVKDTDLAWLAGFWDGEGSITIFTHIEKNGVRKIRPTIGLTNTDENVMAHAISILDALGTSCNIQMKKSNNPKHKDAYQLTSMNMKYIQIILTAILPYLVCKKAQATLVLRYVTKKLQYIEKGQRPPYDDEDVQMQVEVQAMNKRGKPETPLSSETTCETH